VKQDFSENRESQENEQAEIGLPVPEFFREVGDGSGFASFAGDRARYFSSECKPKKVHYWRFVESHL
jgi:hypothetical protein